MQTMRRIGVQINGKLVGSCDSISKVSSPLFKDILDPWFDIEGFVPEKPSLNKNQQIVLEWLKDEMNASSITSVLWLLLDDALEVDYDTDGSEAWNRLPIDQKFQVLAAFAEWGSEEVVE